MGARVGVLNRRRVAGELVGDVEVVRAAARRDLRSARPRCRGSSTSCRSSRSSARSRTGRRRCRGAEELRAKETDRIETVTDALRAIGVRIEARPDGFTVRGVPARPRGGTIDAAGDHRDRDARRDRGRRLARGRPDRGRRMRGDKLPRLLRPPRGGEQSGDRRDRRAGRSRQEHGRPRARGAARLPLPRHGRDVPRAHVARAPARRCRSARASSLGALARREPGLVRRGGPRAHRRHRRHRGDPPVAASTGWCRSSRGTPRCAR